MRLENGVEADDGNAANNANRSGRGGLRLAVAALLASLSASLTGAEGVKARVGESLMRNPLVRATMATAAVETGGWSGIRAAANDSEDDNTRIGPLSLEEERVVTMTDDGPLLGTGREV